MIWLIGNKGMLGTEISQLLEKNNIAFTGTDKEVDITDIAALDNFSKENNFDWVINCAGYTAVDKAEDDFENCQNINAIGAGNIAACAKNKNAKLIHISTDYVFDGKGIIINGIECPYKEDDLTNPIGFYGLSKRDGELSVLEKNPCSFIIRTAWLYGKNGNNFVNTMLRLMKEREEINVVNDQRGSPTWAFDLAFVIISFIRKEKNSVPYGIYHYTNEGNITWFDFAKEIYSQGHTFGFLDKDCKIKPCTSAEYPAKVKRPSFSVLDKKKIKTALEIEIPSWDISLMEYLKSCEN